MIIPSLVEKFEEDEFTFFSCFYCGTVVYATRNSDKAIFVSNDLLNGTKIVKGAKPTSKAFGIRVGASDASGAAVVEEDVSSGKLEAKATLKKMLETYKESCMAEMNAKIKEFTEKMQAETKSLISEANSDAKTIWSKIVELEARKKKENKQEGDKIVEEKDAEDESKIDDSKLDDSKIEVRSSGGGVVVGSGGNGGGTWKRTKGDEIVRGQQKLGSRSRKAEPKDMKLKTTMFGDSLWALDEEEMAEPQKENRRNALQE